MVGGLMIVDDDDERLTLQADGHFHGEVVPEEDPDRWRQLEEPEDIVQFYDPTDVFGDLAESIAEAFPASPPSSGRRRRQATPTTRRRLTRPPDHLTAPEAAAAPAADRMRLLDAELIE
jgi:hypothetical protein